MRNDRLRASGKYLTLSAWIAANSRTASKETNMNQIYTNEVGFRHQAPRANGPWTRFVHAVDGGVDAMVGTLLVWQRRHRDRLHLMSMDDRLLRDIGISNADVDREASKPFWRG